MVYNYTYCNEMVNANADISKHAVLIKSSLRMNKPEAQTSVIWSVHR